jgi:hypothetical protein
MLRVRSTETSSEIPLSRKRKQGSRQHTVQCATAKIGVYRWDLYAGGPRIPWAMARIAVLMLNLSW